MKISWARALFAGMLIIWVWGCSTVTEQDLTDLHSANAVVMKEAIEKIARGPSFPLSLMDGLVSKTNEKRAVTIMVELLQDGKESKDVQLSLLTALGELGRKTQVPVTPLIEKLKDKDPQIRVRVIETLARTKNKETSTALVKMLNDETDKYPIIWALGEIGDQEAIPALNRFAASEDKNLSYNARQALAKIRTDETGVHSDPDQSDTKSLLEIGRMVFRKYREVMMALFQKMAHIRRA